MSGSIFLQRDSLLDRFAIGLSGLCVVHCLVSAVLIGLAASAAGALMNPLFHEVGLMVAIGFGAVALGRGMMTHGYMMPAAVGGLGLGVMMGALQLPHGGGETLWTMIGVGLLALGHDLNRRAIS
ncbi:MerC domain-containing protein [Sphingomonas sp. ac-8]|uniref:MerC domain-containing protein n=1 Tax=Sphingomonas sp. ac-8 TaxID=3242977 RepID=UPI003A811E43